MGLPFLARRLWALAAALAAAALLAAPARAADDFLEAALAFRGSARMADARTLELRFDIAPGYHLYRERLAVERVAGAARLGELQLPRGEIAFDANFDKDVESYRGPLVARLPLEAGDGDVRLLVSHQGCADAGLCYPPQTAQVDLRVDGGTVRQVAWRAEAQAAAGPDGGSGAATPAAPAATSATDGSRVDAALRSRSLPTIAGVFLLAGLLLSFTPCVLPMVPILSSIIVGQGAPVSRWRGFSLALSYALGMALVYTLFGVVAGLLGEGLAAALQDPWVLGGFALLLVGLSLSMFGVYELQLPAALQSHVSAASNRLPGGRHAGVFAMGGLSALIVGPCVAAPLAGALVYISQTRDVLIGGAALFSLACGMSVPLLLVGVSAGSLLPRAGAWMEGVKRLFGVMLLAVALWIVAPVLPAAVVMLCLGAAALFAAAWLGLLDRPAASGTARLGKGVALLLAVVGAAELVGALSGSDSALQPLRHLAATTGDARADTAAAAPAFRRIRSTEELDAALRSADRPVLLDFYADWCVSCKEMEHLTFRDAAVRARLSQALLLQADVTGNSPADRALLKRFALFGPPGVLFFDAAGREQTEARVIGFMPPQRFAEALARVGL